MQEIWKDIPYYEDYYQISNHGNVKTKERTLENVNGKKSLYKSKERKPSLSEYRMIALSKNGYVKMFKISRIVATVFVDGYSEKNRVVNHVDGNKYNDFYKNLEWCSYSENTLHAYNNKLAKRKNGDTGVFFDGKRKKWTSYLYRNNKNIFVGRFSSKEEAEIAYKNKLNDYNSNKRTFS